MADLTFDLPELDAEYDDEPVIFTVGGESYTAIRPGEYAFERLFAVLSPGTTNVEKVRAMLGFMDAAIPEDERVRVEARLADRADPLRSYSQLFEPMFGLCEYWGADTSEVEKPEPLRTRPAGNRADRRAVKKTAAKKATGKAAGRR
jgi:hypothetical protein